MTKEREFKETVSVLASYLKKLNMKTIEQENKELREENERLNLALTIINKVVELEKKKQAQQTQAL